MAEIIDSQGRIFPAVIAQVDVTLVDPVTGAFRKVFAGEAIPGGLEAAYEAAIRPSTKTKKEAASAERK